MKDILFIARAHIATALRERVTLFWFLIPPVFLLTILTLIFGQIGQEGEISFDITLINQDRSASAENPFSDRIESVFRELATAQDEATQPLFTLHTAEEDANLEKFLESELKELRQGRRAAVLVIPTGFSDAVMGSLIAGSTEVAEIDSLRIYMSDTSVSSTYATQIIQQVLTEIDRHILIQAGQFDPDRAISSETQWIGRQDGETPYVDFVLPGIILMGFFTNGLFGVPGTILFNRDRKVLRRYWVTPLSVLRYLAGFGLGHLTLCGLQFVLLYLLGIYVFGATISFAAPDTILLLVLAAVTFMAFGFLIASLAKTANAGMATANILNMPMMFLSG
ncbi:ABC transporter permease, partial [Candidatus Bipolaricaulota bacterium]|nr:ABC transporter permease [Candidatus Bipolaricaulota bacterium]